MTRTFTVVGITGGIGGGKSAVASIFEQEGASSVDADAIAHGVVERPDVRRRLVKAFGPAILHGGRVHRTSLAAAAFRNAAGVARLNRATHPAIDAELRKALRAARKRGGIFVIDAALLMESGISHWCDVLVYVDTPREVRERRVKSRGWDRGELRKRERFQWSAARKRAAADYVLPNGGSKAETRKGVRTIVMELSRAKVARS